MMAIHQRWYALSIVALSLGMLLTACNILGDDEADSPPDNALILQWTVSTSLGNWAGEMVNEFNDADFTTSDDRPIWVQVTKVDAGEATSQMLGGGALPTLWTAADPSWRAVLNQESGSEVFLTSCISVAESPLVIGMWEPIARVLGWPARDLGWLDIASLAADPSGWAYYSGGEFGERLRIGHTHPGLSDSGVQTLQSLVYAAQASPDRITAADVENPIVQASVGSFESAVAAFSANAEALRSNLLDRGVSYLNAAVMYESDVVTQGERDPRIVAIYPFEGTFMATFPTCVRNNMDDVTTDAAETFIAYLIDLPAQQSALAYGLRPIHPDVSLAAPISPEFGANPNQPQHIFAFTEPQTVFAIQDLWQSQRKNVNLAMVLDISGSMDGDKIDQVRLSATEFVQQMGNDDRLTVIVFSSTPSVWHPNEAVGGNREAMIADIGLITAGGDTALYDSIGFAAQQLTETRSSGHVNAMVVLTDGQDNQSVQYAGVDQALRDIVATSDASVYTIAYGDDADRAVLEEIAITTNGIAYEGDVSTIDDIYLEISAAFGGSLGIGR